jgi:hypothetical protein
MHGSAPAEILPLLIPATKRYMLSISLVGIQQEPVSRREYKGTIVPVETHYISGLSNPPTFGIYVKNSKIQTRFNENS